MKKRLLALLLAFVMVIGMIPTIAAAETEPAAEPDEVVAPAQAAADYTVEVGESIQIQGTRDDWSRHNWSSNKRGIVTVSRNGSAATVTGVAEGTVTITHTWGRNHSETFTVTVVAASDEVKVYVYVNGSGYSDEALDVLGIASNTVDGNGYFPVGEITLARSFLNSKGQDANTIGQPLINSSDDWEAVLAALGELDTSTLIDKYAANKDNHIGEYLDKAIGDLNARMGSQKTALFRWDMTTSYGFADQSVKYHLDLRFQTYTITFITGNNGITSGPAADGTTVDTRTYVSGFEVLPPRNLTIPAGYVKTHGYYSDPNFKTDWNGIGKSLDKDETVYIQLTKFSDVTLYYEAGEGGTVDPTSESLNPETGVASGSTAAPDTGYRFDGWYSDKDYTTKVSNDLTFVPTKKANEVWVNGTTWYAKFVKNTYDYTVEYYIDGKINDSLTENHSAEYEAVINTYTDNRPNGYKLEKTENLPLTIGTDESANVIKVYYVKDDSQTQNTKYTVKYKIEGVEQPDDEITVTDTAWINDDPAMIAIAAEGIPTPADKYTGYKLDPENPTYPAAGTLVTSGTVYTVNYIKDEGQTKDTKYTVKYTIEGVEQAADTIEVTGTAWINDSPAMIAIAAEGIPTPANKYTGYKLDPANPEYPAAGTEVETGSTFTVNYVKDGSQTQNTEYTVKYTVEGVEQPDDEITVTGTAWVNDDPAKIEIAAGGIPAPANKYTGYKLDPNNPAYPAAGTLVNSGSEYTVNYVKDDSQTQGTKYTIKYTIEGVEQTADKIEVTGTAWINDNPAQIEIAEGGIPTPADKYTGYKLDPANPEYPAAGTEVETGSTFTVNYVKDDSQTQDTKYTVKYTVEGVEKTADRIEVTGTAWINDNPAQIEIAAGGIPAPANKYTGYKLDPSNPEYPAAGTLVNSGTVFVVNYIKKENPTPAVFDPDDIDGDGTVLAEKELIVLRGSAPEETFEVAIKDRVTGATMLTGEATFSGRGGQKAFYFGRTLEFYYAGTYTYTVSETEGNTRWMSYDDSVYELEIVVKLDEEQNKLYVDSVNLYGWSNPSIVFTNTYDRKTGTVVIPTTPSQLNTDDHYAYVIGYPDGSVHPNGEITRAEVATIFFRLLRDEVRDANFTSYNSYTDVSADKWYNNPVSTMSRLGIIKGYPDGTFRPNDPITRAEFAAIAARFDEHKAAKLASFTDIYGHWAVSEISLAYENGWIKGYSDGTFRPNRNITRAEAMALINRVLNRAPEKPSDLLNDMNKWTDNLDTTKWYYLDVQEATNSHDYTRKTNNYEMWKKMLTDPNWAKYER